MDIADIRSSGLLELYVIDQLSPAEKAEVEGYLTTYPELRQDLREIESGLEFYARSAAKTIPSGLKDTVMKAIRNEGSTKPGTGKGGNWKFIAMAFGLGAVLFGYLFWQKQGDVTRLENELRDLRDTCQTREQKLTEQLEILQQLTQPDNQIFAFTPTSSFAGTDLYLHHNKSTRRNFIQVRALPEIASDQTFELWSIIPGHAPARLDLFQDPADRLIEVQYVEGTQIYAITIEDEGGVDSPTMEHLIGTVAVGGL